MGNLKINFAQAQTKFEHLMKKQLLIRNIFYKKIFGGKGMEFDSYRAYVPFYDDASLIDWKATMRNAGKPLVRQYIEEKDLKIFFIVDVGDNMVFGSGDKLKNEIVAEMIAAIANLIILFGDSVGFALYSDKVKKIIMPSRGVESLNAIKRAFLDPNTYGGKSDLGKTLKFLMPILKNISAAFIISDFFNLNE